MRPPRALLRCWLPSPKSGPTPRRRHRWPRRRETRCSRPPAWPGARSNREPYMSNWVDVYDDEELWDGDMAGVTVGKEKILIMRANDQLRAFKDSCPHKATPLSDGDLDGEVLTC